MSLLQQHLENFMNLNVKNVVQQALLTHSNTILIGCT